MSSRSQRTPLTETTPTPNGPLPSDDEVVEAPSNPSPELQGPDTSQGVERPSDPVPGDKPDD